MQLVSVKPIIVLQPQTQSLLQDLVTSRLAVSEIFADLQWQKAEKGKC